MTTKPSLEVGRRRQRGRGRRIARLAWSVVLAVGGEVHGQALPSAIAPQSNSRSDAAPALPGGRIFVVGSPDTAASLQRVVGSERIGAVAVQWERLDRLSRDTLLSRSGGDTPLVRCWIDVSSKNQALLYFADRSAERFLVRSLPISPKVTELELETIAQVVETSLGAILDSSSKGLSRKNVEEVLRLQRTPDAPPPPRPTAPPTSTHEVESVAYGPKAALGYAFEANSQHIPWLHGPGLSLGVVRHGKGQNQSLSFGFGYLFPQSHEHGSVGYHVSAYRLRASLEFDILLQFDRGASASKAAYIGFVLTGGANLNHVSTQPGASSPARVATEPDQLVLLPLCGVGLRLGHPFGSWVLSVGADLELALERLSFDVKVNGQLDSIDRTHLIHPALLTQIVWD